MLRGRFIEHRSSKAGRQQLIAEGEDRLLLLLPTGIRPDFEMITLPDQPHLFSSCAKLPQLGATKTAGGVERLFGRKPTSRRPSSADCCSRLGAETTLSPDRFPGGCGIEEEAAMRVGGEHQGSVGAATSASR